MYNPYSFYTPNAQGPEQSPADVNGFTGPVVPDWYKKTAYYVPATEQKKGLSTGLIVGAAIIIGLLTLK